MINRLSADELAELIGCKPNQRSLMIRWLLERQWKFEVDRLGLPIVARLYYNRKMGIEDGDASPKYADEPNRKAFSDSPSPRRRAKRTDPGTDMS